MSQISTDDFWETTPAPETTTQRIGAFNGDLDSFDDVFGDVDVFFDEDGNVIPTTLPPTECDASGNCFFGIGDGFDDASAEDDDESEQVSLSGGFSRIYNGCLGVVL